jgi:hypothetical protein
MIVMFVDQGQEYADAYYLQYKRQEAGGWTRFKDRKGVDVSYDL